MSYRDTAEALRAHRTRVASDLEEARRAAKEASERAARASGLEEELAETERLLENLGERRTLPLLESLRIATPCTASWEAMEGDDRVRFCGDCKKNVYNLSAMPRGEAEALLLEREGTKCVRLSQRADGTVITGDCDVGVRRRRRRRLAVGAAVGGGLLAAVASIEYSAVTTRVGGVRMGEVRVSEDTPTGEVERPAEPARPAGQSR
jgi:hypothetical protein